MEPFQSDQMGSVDLEKDKGKKAKIINVQISRRDIVEEQYRKPSNSPPPFDESY